MKLRLVYFSLLLMAISSLTWLSCKKNIKDEPVAPTTSEFPIPAATPVTGSVSGIVVDENNTPVNGAEVSLGANTATTGANGSFIFKSVTLDKYISTVTINKTGYFKAFRSFSANATMNYVSIKLIPKTLASTVSSDNPSVVNLSNGSTIALQPNSIVVKSTGAVYTGQVNVYAAYIDPTAADISTSIPGSLMARDGNNLYSLQSTGMIAVDLESPGGQALQLASNMPAAIKLPIPTSLQGKAPATIDTWSLDDQGVWKKEGTATKNGNAYDMQVTHFSFWNCDVPTNSTYLTIHVQDQDGNSLSNTMVSLTVPNNNTWWSTTYGFTDSLGNVSGVIPAGVEMEMNVYSNAYNCSSALATQMVGPFTTSSTITVTVNIPSSQVLTVSGTATDCNSQPVQNGTAIIFAGQYNIYYTSIVNGIYSVDITHCVTIDSVNVTLIDNGTGFQAGSGNVTVTGNSVTIPAISLCGTAQTAVFTFNNSQGNCQMGTFTGGLNAGVPATPNSVISIFVNVTTPGTYAITTNTTNGISFSGSGVFNQTGQQMVFLTATGTPVDAGSYTFITQSGTITGCPFSIVVNSAPAPQAGFDLGSGVCSNVVVNGVYEVGVPLITSNSITLTLNVTSPGSYFITTNLVNGIYFQDSGTITTTGPITLQLMGSGIPNAPGTANLTLMTNTGIAGCAFPVVITGGTGNALFTFEGAPGSCSGVTTNGPFTTNVPLNGQSTATIMVNVTTIGAYNIVAGSTNGILFQALGTFTQTGLQPVVMSASGTPLAAGTYTFVTQSNGVSNGCIFTVQVN